MQNIQTLLRLDPPCYILFAKDADYEHAWKIPWGTSKPKDKEMKDFLGKSVDVCAFEINYRTVNDTQFYFGAKTGKFWKNQLQGIEFLKAVSDSIWDANEFSFQHVAKRISNQLTGNLNGFSYCDMTDIIMLVADWWKTFGDVTIWKKGEPKISTKRIIDKLQAYNSILQNEKNFAVIEPVFGNNDHWSAYWFAFQVSRKIEKKWKLDTELLSWVLTEIL